MDNKKNLFLVVGLLFLLTVGVVILYLYFSNQGKTITTEVEYEKALQPNITGVYVEELPIELMLTEEQITIPKEMSLLEIVPEKIEDREAKTVAQNLGLNFEPNTYTGVVHGRTFMWKGVDAYLVAKLDSGIIEYNLNEIPKTEKKEIDRSFVEKEIDKFTSVNIPFPNNKYIVSSLRFLKIPVSEGSLVETTEKEADFIRVNVVPVTTKYDIITLNPNETENYFDFLPNGQLYRFKITKISEAISTEDTFKIKNFNQINDTLHNAQLTLITSPSFTIYEPPPFSNIRSLQITSIKLGYIASDEKSNIFTPVFLLEGPIRIDGYRGDLTAHLYLTATFSN